MSKQNELNKDFYEISMEISYWEALSKSTSQPAALRAEAESKLVRLREEQAKLQQQILLVQAGRGAVVDRHVAAEEQRMREQAEALLDNISYFAAPCRCGLTNAQATQIAARVRPGGMTPCPVCRQLIRSVVALSGGSGAVWTDERPQIETTEGSWPKTPTENKSKKPKKYSTETLPIRRLAPPPKDDDDG